MTRELDPNDFVDPNDVFEDDYDAEEIKLATFTIVPGGQVDYASLVYNESGHGFLGGRNGPKWAISIYGPRYNGQSLPLHDPDEAKHVLEKLSGTSDLEGYDWASVDWAYFE